MNKFIAKFFFGKLIIPIFINPSVSVFINSFIISKNTLYNLKIISEIIEQFLSGNFYKNNETFGDYAPFNRFFLEIIETAYELFSNVIDVILPNSIEKIINNNLEDNLEYEYNYFKENPDEIIFNRSICYTLDDLSVILNLLNKCKEKIFENNKNIKLKKAFDKLTSKQNLNFIEELRNHND